MVFHEQAVENYILFFFPKPFDYFLDNCIGTMIPKFFHQRIRVAKILVRLSKLIHEVAPCVVMYCLSHPFAEVTSENRMLAYE